MSVWRRWCGRRGEEIAVDYLQRRGYCIQERNYRWCRGEVDIIAWDGPTLVFIEVKTKGQMAFGAPQAMVDRRKQRKIVQVAMAYVQQHHLQKVDLRFDVIAILLLPDQIPEVVQIEAAFSPPAHLLY